MIKIGCHMSISGGFLEMGKQAEKIGANVLQFFSRSPRGGAAKPIDMKDMSAYLEFAAKNGFSDPLAHAPYTLNPCASEERLRNHAKAIVAEDLTRLDSLPGCRYNIHPGSHVGQGAEQGVQLVADMLNAVLAPGQTTTVLLETMAGKGSEVGRSFEELGSIIEKVELSGHVGVCLDTCHVFDAGYDIAGGLDAVLRLFDEIIGMERLKAVHLNDSLNPLGSRKDRHAAIGEGKIGYEAFVRIINHPSLKNLPFYLETPNSLDGYAKEIATLKAARLE